MHYLTLHAIVLVTSIGCQKWWNPGGTKWPGLLQKQVCYGFLRFANLG